MAQTPIPGALSGNRFAFENDRSGLEKTVDAPAFVRRCRAIVDDEHRERDDRLQALLQLGTDWLEVEHGHLTRIDVAAGTHTIAVVSGPHPAVTVGTTHDVSETYCRHVIAQNATLVLGEASGEEDRPDPAFEQFGFSTYLGAKVVVDGTLYGTLCFVDREARWGRLGEQEAAAVTVLARAAGEVLAETPPLSSQPTADQLAVLFEQSPNMINIHNAEGDLIAPNPHLVEKTGYTEEELVGMKVWDLDEDVSAEQAAASWADMTTGDRVQWEGTFRRKDGTTFPVEVDLRCFEVAGEKQFVAVSRDITDRKAAEQTLQEERDLLDRILEISPAAIVFLNADGAFVEASERAEAILGLEKEAVTDRTYNDPEWHIRDLEGEIIPDEALPFARVMATGEPVYDVEHWIEWPDGTQRLLSASGAPLRSADGALEGAVFHLTDITEQRAVEEALREERDRFATLFHNLPTPVVHGVSDAEGALRVQSVNERFEEVFGYEEASVRDGNLQELIVPDEEREGAEEMRGQLLCGEPVNREVRRRAADGLRDFRVQVALRREGDRPTEGFAIYTDITERKERERRLARRRALLEAQAEATLDGLLVVDADRQVVFSNRRFRDIWRVSSEHGEAEQGESPQEPELLEAVADLLPDPEAFRAKVEYLYAHPREQSRDLVQLTDGRWVDRYSAPIRGDEGQYFGRLWVFRDVTRQRRMLEQLLEVQEEERRRIDQEIHDGMGGVLTSLQFTVDFARRTADDPEAFAEHLDRIEELVSDLSEVARTISRRLYPSDLSESGLVEGMRALVDEVRRGQELDVTFYSEVSSESRFSSLVERTLYWITQEVLTHIARLDEKDTSQVLLNERQKRLYLHIFWANADPSAFADDPRIQIDVIRRRIKWLNGEVRVDSLSEEGMRFSVALPVQLPFLVE